jgi:guanylate kinase
VGLKRRGTETEESLETRIRKAGKEMAYEVHADKVLVNDRLEDSLAQAIKIIVNFLEQS